MFKPLHPLAPHISASAKNLVTLVTLILILTDQKMNHGPSTCAATQVSAEHSFPLTPHAPAHNRNANKTATTVHNSKSVSYLTRLEDGADEDVARQAVYVPALLRLSCILLITLLVFAGHYVVSLVKLHWHIPALNLKLRWTTVQGFLDMFRGESRGADH